MDRFHDKISGILHSLPGWHTKRHIVVFESDDWGSVRMPSLEVFQSLKSHNIPISEDDGYDVNDTLASNDDLELLMDVLSSVKDSQGNPAKITLNCCVANPDFKRIKENGFQEYYYEPFPETLKRYPHHDRSFELWKEGIGHNVFQPQFHGREHLNALMWLQLLQKNVGYVHVAFDQNVFTMNIDKIDDPRHRVLDAYNVLRKEDYGFACHAVREGLDLFEKLFGFHSKSMIAPCYLWDSEIEKVAFENGVRFIQSGNAQRPSIYAKSQGARIKHHYTGQKNKLGQVYTIRNCTFEPSYYKCDNEDSCMKAIENAFKFYKPAIVCSHRQNFIGELNPANRDGNLLEFQKLLKHIVNKYPDVEFMSSDQLGKIIEIDHDK